MMAWHGVAWRGMAWWERERDEGISTASFETPTDEFAPAHTLLLTRYAPYII